MATGSKREATFAATRRLRDQHPEEFRELLAEELQKRGLPVPRSAEAKAREQVDKLLRDHPQVVYDAVEHQKDNGAAESDG